MRDYFRDAPADAYFEGPEWDKTHFGFGGGDARTGKAHDPRFITSFPTTVQVGEGRRRCVLAIGL